jgi:hypothetical protein
MIFVNIRTLIHKTGCTDFVKSKYMVTAPFYVN